MDKVARDIADQCPDTASKRDLIAYLQRISLYTHQVKLPERVKESVRVNVCVRVSVIVFACVWGGMSVRVCDSV